MKHLATLFILFYSINAFAQIETLNERNFRNIFIENYQELSKPPLKNYFVILDNTIKTSFTIDNPFFIGAIEEIGKQNKINQRQSLDTLFNRSFKYLRQNSIWVSSPKVLEKDKDFFQVYNTEICPCLTSSVKKSDKLEIMVDAQKNCFSKLLFDTTMVNKIKAKGGTKTLNDISKLQPYFAMFFYENCDILNYKFNETLNNIAVEQYSNEVSKNKIKDVENLIKYYNSNKLDTLKIMFPNYLKFKIEFDNLIELTKKKDVNFRYFYTGKFNGTERNIILRVIDKNRPIGDFTFINSSNTFNTNVSSLYYKKRKIPKDGVIEIREVTVSPE